MKSWRLATSDRQIIEALTAIIHNSVFSLLLDKMEIVNSKEKKLTFGKIGLSVEGITLKNKLLPWLVLAGIYLDIGLVVGAKNAYSKGENR